MRLPTPLLPLSVLVFSGAGLSAATTSFSGVTYADALVSTNGTLIGALNFGSATLIGVTTTINTVDFARYSANAGTVTFGGGASFVHNGATGEGANGAGDETTLTHTGVFNTAGTDDIYSSAGSPWANSMRSRWCFPTPVPP